MLTVPAGGQNQGLPPVPNQLAGTVVQADGSAAPGAIVYVTIHNLGSGTLSSLDSSSNPCSARNRNWPSAFCWTTIVWRDSRVANPIREGKSTSSSSARRARWP